MVCGARAGRICPCTTGFFGARTELKWKTKIENFLEINVHSLSKQCVGAFLISRMFKSQRTKLRKNCIFAHLNIKFGSIKPFPDQGWIVKISWSYTHLIERFCTFFTLFCPNWLSIFLSRFFQKYSTKWLVLDTKSKFSNHWDFNCLKFNFGLSITKNHLSFYPIYSSILVNPPWWWRIIIKKK